MHLNLLVMLIKCIAGVKIWGKKDVILSTGAFLISVTAYIVSAIARSCFAKVEDLKTARICIPVTDLSICLCYRQGVFAVLR